MSSSLRNKGTWLYFHLQVFFKGNSPHGEGGRGVVTFPASPLTRAIKSPHTSKGINQVINMRDSYLQSFGLLRECSNIRRWPRGGGVVRVVFL